MLCFALPIRLPMRREPVTRSIRTFAVGIYPNSHRCKHATSRTPAHQPPHEPLPQAHIPDANALEAHRFDSSGSPLSILPRRATAPAEPAAEARLEAAGRALLALALIATAVVAPVAARAAATAAAALPLAVVARQHAARRRVRALLLDVRLRHDLGRQVQPLAQVVEALGRERVVVPLPRELRLDVAAGVEGLHRFDDLSGGV